MKSRSSVNICLCTDVVLQMLAGWRQRIFILKKYKITAHYKNEKIFLAKVFVYRELPANFSRFRVHNLM